MNNRFLSAETVIESLRDNGYNNTAYALAELIDNSLQADASRVEVGFIEEQTNPDKKNYTVTEISLWDNGKGMDVNTLRIAMQFGGGTNRNDERGMGKFGMGLPNSSISQCKRVDVWSWQNGNLPNHTYLDVDEMKVGALENVPEPEPREMPIKYRNAFFSQMPISGTLVVWSKLDRLAWKTGKSIYRHCEHLVGRMYRNFINNENIKIESIIYRPSGKNILSAYERHTFKANDPMYLLKNTSLPQLAGHYKNEAFFEKVDEESIPIDYLDDNGLAKTANVTITTSIVKASIANYILTNTSSSLGATVWGKHCAKNIGVSLVRANRELVLRDSFIPSDLRNFKGRFCGIEVSFPPCLDAIFGVTNNKQDAVRLIPYSMKSIADQAGFETEAEYKRDLEENSDSLLQVFKVTDAIAKHVKELERRLKEININGKVHIDNENDDSTSPSDNAATRATHGSDHRDKYGHPSGDGKKESFDTSDVIDHLITAGGMTPDMAKKKAERLMLSGNRFLIEDVARDSDAFFDVSTSKGLTLVLFNTNHIFHQKLLSQLGKEHLEVMQTAIAGFARVMNETTDPARVKYLNSVRRDWGVVITDFLLDPSLLDADEI